jgi:hypothetical protein
MHIFLGSLPLVAVVVVAAVLVTGLAGFLLLASRRELAHGRLTPRHHRDEGPNRRRRCRYCYWGQAELTEETVRLDGDHLVDVRCFVCGSCGLPQWWVDRTPVTTQSTG